MKKLVLTIREKVDEVYIIMADYYSNGTWDFRLEKFKRFGKQYVR